MKKYLAKMLRRAAQKLDPQKPASPFLMVTPNTTSAASTITYHEVR